MGRRGFVDEEKGVVFFWSQKCACTTLFSTLKRTYGGDNRDYLVASRDWFDCEKVIRDRGFKSAIIIREPIERMISCYINKFVFRRKKLKEIGDLEGFSVKLFEQRNEIMPGADPTRNTMTFEEFLDTITHVMSRRRDFNDNTVDGHWDTQIPLAALNFEYDHVVRMENFQDGYAELCSLYGLDYVPKVENKSVYTAGDTGYLGTVPGNELCEMDYSQASFRSQATDRLIRYLHAIDFIRFDY